MKQLSRLGPDSTPQAHRRVGTYLVHQFVPSGMGLSVCSQAPLDVNADVMNGRSRKTLDWYTPHEVYSGKLAKFEDPTQILQ